MERVRPNVTGEPATFCKFERDMFHDVAEPGSLVFAKTADETTRLAVRATVFVQPGQQLQQGSDEILAEPAGRPFLEHAEVEYMAYDREVRENIGSNVNVGADNLHEPGSSILVMPNRPRQTPRGIRFQSDRQRSVYVI